MQYHIENVIIGENAPQTISAIIEMPQGSQNKYEFDARIGAFALDRVPKKQLQCPFDYGFIPQTLSEDGDALDILVMGSEPTFVGCVVEARPIGVLIMLDDNKRDHKILAVQNKNPRLQNIQKLSDVKQSVLDAIAKYFSKSASFKNEPIEVVGWQDFDSSRQEIIASHARWERAKNSQSHP